MKLLSAGLMVMMLIFLFPRAKQMLSDSPKGSTSDWMTALIPLGLVAGFVVLLIALV